MLLCCRHTHTLSFSLSCSLSLTCHSPLTLLHLYVNTDSIFSYLISLHCIRSFCLAVVLVFTMDIIYFHFSSLFFCVCVCELYFVCLTDPLFTFKFRSYFSLVIVYVIDEACSIVSLCYRYIITISYFVQFHLSVCSRLLPFRFFSIPNIRCGAFHSSSK